jgi:hypothetical protein
VAHYPGSPQGRHPQETGPHGCTLVQVDAERNARTTLIPTDVLRWQQERVVVDESTSRDDLEFLINDRMRTLVETIPEMDLLVSWTIVGSGPVLAELRRGALGGQLLEALRTEFGFGPPAAWSVSLVAEPTAVLPPDWYEQQTIRGDFLRELRQEQMEASGLFDLEPFVPEPLLAGALGALVQPPDERSEERVLREVALLGVDLLSGEEPES